jgi:hypothetical protein
MKSFVSELQYLSELYSRLHTEFSAQPLEACTDISMLSEAILHNRELLTRVEQMNSRLTQLAGEWASFWERLAPESRSAVKKLAAAANDQAVQLSAVCERRIRQLETGRNGLQKTLDGARTGSRYLASIKPAKTNYPKFLDSHG